MTSSDCIADYPNTTHLFYCWLCLPYQQMMSYIVLSLCILLSISLSLYRSLSLSLLLSLSLSLSLSLNTTITIATPFSVHIRDLFRHTDRHTHPQKCIAMQMHPSKQMCTNANCEWSWTTARWLLGKRKTCLPTGPHAVTQLGGQRERRGEGEHRSRWRGGESNRGRGEQGRGGESRTMRNQKLPKSSQWV